MKIEICNECGEAVTFGTGLFVNRVMDFNSKEERILMKKPFPSGDFICSLCEKEIEDEYQIDDAGNTRITD